MVFDVAVIGGGASGMVAAIAAKRQGASVVIIECGPRLGKKILATGNGKCNALPAAFSLEKYNTAFVKQIFEKWSLEHIRKFFEDLGIYMREDKGRLYPYSFQATSVQNALRSEVEKLGINVAIDTKITKIKFNKCFELVAEKQRILADKVILSSGSPAGFGTSSTELYKDFGHTVRPFAPSLCPVITEKEPIKGLRGVRTNAKVSIIQNGQTITQSEDEILFKDNGISGTAIFDVSVSLARADFSEKNVYLEIDFLPDISVSEATKFIEKCLNSGNSLEGLAHKEILRNVCEKIKMQPPYGKDAKAIFVFSERFAKTIKSYSIRLESLGSFELAQVASGGLVTSEFDGVTLESKKQKGLFATGECLDVDGECGGYNLYWAWASGLAAGIAASKEK